MHIFRFIEKNSIVNQKSYFSVKLQDAQKNLKRKIICLEEIYKYNLIYFLIRCVVFILIVKNAINFFKHWYPARSACFVFLKLQVTLRTLNLQLDLSAQTREQIFFIWMNSKFFIIHKQISKKKYLCDVFLPIWKMFQSYFGKITDMDLYVSKILENFLNKCLLCWFD